MVKVMFVCHGNICRSPMAQSIFSHLVKEKSLDSYFQIESSATSREELSMPPHYGTVSVLKKHNIQIIEHKAYQITKEIAKEYDYLICMDKNNVYNLKKIIDKSDYNKISLLLSYSDITRDIRDPWYTNNFKETYDDIYLGCTTLLNFIVKKGL